METTNLGTETTVVQIEGGLTERGNLKQAVAREIRDQAYAQFLDGFEDTPKGDKVMLVAEVDGVKVYIKGNLSVSIADNLFDAPKASKSKAQQDAPEVGAIFG